MQQIGKSMNYEHGYSDQEFQQFCGLIYKHTGITMNETKSDLVYSRISRRLSALDLDSFEEYRYIIESGSNENETEAFINAVTTNLTSFFRQDYHFEYLAKILKQYVKENKKHIRIWSSASSTGEEPYSIAYTVKKTIPNLSNYDIKILATDIDSEVLETARAGVYSLDKMDKLDSNFIKEGFLKGGGELEGKVKVRPELQDLVSFRKLNLMDSWPMHGPFDVIFCRNVVIYFDKETQQKLFSKFAKLQNHNDYMLIGHSENLFKVSNDYNLIEKGIYTKK